MKKITITILVVGFFTMMFSIEPWIISGKSIENTNWVMFGVGFVVFAVGLYLVTYVDDFNSTDSQK